MAKLLLPSDLPAQLHPHAVHYDVASQSVADSKTATAAICDIGYEARFLRCLGQCGVNKYRCDVFNSDQFRHKTGVVGFGLSTDAAAYEALALLIAARNPITKEAL